MIKVKIRDSKNNKRAINATFKYNLTYLDQRYDARIGSQ
jgi:hypothetical protein